MVRDPKFLHLLRTVSFIEGISTLLLFFVAMPLKYLAGFPLAVTIFGSIHGLLFLVVVGLFFIGADRIPLSFRLMLAGILGAIVPFGPFLVDRRLKRLVEA